jgi:anti-sigma regulatory factor (Ser/Thr protein kinase)
MTEEMTVLGEITLPGVEPSAARARRFMRETLGAGHPALDDVQVCTCELLNNGLRHTKSGQGGQINLKLGQAAGTLWVEVTDDGADGARPRLRSPNGESGRGLHIVDALAARWGYVPVGDRTTVWAEFGCGAAG